MLLLDAFNDCDVHIFPFGSEQTAVSSTPVVFMTLLHWSMTFPMPVAQADAISRFLNAAMRCGLTVSLKKTEVMLQLLKPNYILASCYHGR